MALAHEDRLAKVLAFFQRAFGLHRRASRPMQQLSRRSLRALDGLASPRESLRFRLALEHLRFDWDLLEPEAARNADALRLQLRVLDLSAEFPAAERLMRHNLEEAPLGRLFCAVIAQAWESGAREIGIAFATESINVTVDGREAVTIPSSLDRPFRGVLRFIESASYSRVRSMLWKKDGLPANVTFAWPETHLAVLSLA